MKIAVTTLGTKRFGKKYNEPSCVNVEWSDDHIGNNLLGAIPVPSACFTERMLTIDELGVPVKRKIVEGSTLCMFLAICFM